MNTEYLITNKIGMCYNNDMCYCFLKSPYFLEMHVAIFTDEMICWVCFKMNLYSIENGRVWKGWECTCMTRGWL